MWKWWKQHLVWILALVLLLAPGRLQELWASDAASARQAPAKQRSLSPSRSPHTDELAAIESLLRKGEFQQAQAKAQLLVQRQPGNGAAWMLLGMACLHQQKQQPAIRAFEEARKYNGRDPRLHFNLALLYASRREVDLAISSFQKGLEIDKNNPTANYNYARLLMSQGRYNEAVQPLHLAIRANPRDADAKVALVETLLGIQKKEEAVAQVEGLLAGSGYPGSVWVSLARILLSADEAKLAFSVLERARASDPGNVDVHIQLSKTFCALHQDEQALRSARRALEIQPNGLIAAMAYAETLISLKRYQESLQFLSGLTGGLRNNAAYWYTLGLVHFGLTNHWEAAAALEKALQLDFSFDLAQFFLGTILLTKGSLEQAETHFKSAIALNPRNAWYYSYLMRVYQRKGSQFGEAALENARKAVSLNPNDADSRLELAKWEIGRQNLDQARRILEDLIKEIPEFVPARFALARVYTRLNLKVRAEEQTKVIVELENRFRGNPAQESYYLERSMYLLNSGQLVNALAVLDQATAKLPVSYRLTMMRGLVAIYREHFTEAIESYRLAVRLNPDSAEANYSLAVALQAEARIPEAAATLEQGIRRFPSDALHYQEYASVLHRYAQSSGESDRDRVVSLLKRALELDPSLSESHALLGEVFLHEGKTEQAVNHLEAAAKLSPGSSKPHSLLSRAYRDQGRNSEALSELELFQKMKGREQKDEQAARLLQLVDR